MNEITAEKLRSSFRDSQRLELELTTMKFPASLRAQVALGCFAIARQHFLSILILIDTKPPLASSAHALYRIFLEAVLRGQWIYYCASDKQVENFLEKDNGQLDMSSLVTALDKKLGGIGLHENVYQKMWPLLSSFTHTFSRQVAFVLSSKGLDDVFSDEQIQVLLEWSSRLLNLVFSSIRAISSSLQEGESEHLQ